MSMVRPLLPRPLKEKGKERALSLANRIFLLEPSTGTVLGTTANCDMAAMQTAIQSAYNAQPKYFFETTAASRGSLLRKWHDLVMANIDDCTFTLPPKLPYWF